MTITIGFQLDNPLDSYHHLSIVSMESPHNCPNNDMFSSDLPEDVLETTFCRVGKSGLLKSKLLALNPESNEYVPEWFDKRALIRRWE